MKGSNADFALHMEGIHAGLIPNMEGGHSFRDQKFQTTYLYEISDQFEN